MNEETAQGAEYTPIRGANIKNWIVTISCTAAIVWAVGLAYSGLKSDQQLTDLRLKVLEAQMTIIQQQLREIKR